MIIINGNFFIITSRNYHNVKNSFFGYYYDENIFSLHTLSTQLLDKYTCGAFVNIQRDINKITIQQDYYCSFGIYVFKHNQFWAISNSFFLLLQYLAKDFPLTPNYEYHDLYIGNMVAPVATETAINEITELPQGQFLEIDIESGNIEIGQYIYQKSSINPFDKEGIEFLDKWHLKFSQIIAALSRENFTITADLSGGFDSRTALSILFKPSQLAEVAIFSRDDDVADHKEDYQIASKIAKIYGFEFRNVQPETIHLSSYKALLNSLCCKFFVHSQLFFKGYCYKFPLFSINGSGGEACRTFFDIPLKEYLKSIPQSKKLAWNCLNRQLEFIFKNYKENIPDVIKLYIYTRVKNHFGRTIIESFLSNIISISPLMDPRLAQFDISKERCPSRNCLYALIIDRYMPDILTINMTHNQTFSNEEVGFVKGINKQFPPLLDCSSLTDHHYTISIGSNAANDYPIPPSVYTPMEHYISLYKSPPVKALVDTVRTKGKWDYGINGYDSSQYCGFWGLTNNFFHYFLHKILMDKRGISNPYYLFYFPHTTLSKCCQFPLVAELNLSVTSDGTNRKIQISKSIINSSRYEKRYSFNFSGTAIFSIAPPHTRQYHAIMTHEYGYTNYAFDIHKMQVKSNTKSANTVLLSNVYWIDKPIEISYKFNKDEEFFIYIDLLPNSIYHMNLFSDFSDIFSHNDHSRIHAGDTVSNMFNM